MNTIPLLSLLLLLPLLAALPALLAAENRRFAHGIGITTSALVLLAAIWMGIRGVGPGFTQVEEISWIPALGAAWRLGVDGVSYPLVLLTAMVFLSGFIFSAKIDRRPGVFVALGLMLETACLGVFLALDVLLFYVFFEVSLVGMYFIIAQWGHEDRRSAGLLFFLYTLAGSLILLLGLLSLYLHGESATFDLRVWIASPPLASGLAASFTFWALVVGFAIKTPIFPLHTWLPKAHTEAPAAGSAILAGILLKLGAYGFIRFALQMMPGPFREFAGVLLIVAIVSAIYGALVALAQTDLKRMVAYTSINHMGYLLFGVAVAAQAAPAAAAHALSGATLQMVSHGIVTAMLFLLVGALQDRTGTREMAAMSGVLHAYPRLSGLFILAAFASLGLPGLAHFPAEFQIFLGGFAVSPAAVLCILTGLALTAALYLRSIQTVFMGDRSRSLAAGDLDAREGWAIAPLAVITLAIGIYPGPLLAVIRATVEHIGS